MKMEKCTKCGSPMRRMGFEENQRKDTVFTYKCEKCGYTMKNVEAAADAMKRPLSTLRSARRGTSLQLRVGDRLDDANGGVGGHRWTPEHGGREDRLCLRAASGRSWHEAGDGLGGARGDHGAEEGVSRPDPILNELARIEALRAELRRLRGEVLRLEEDNRVLQERIAFLVRELEQMRAKVPRGISTS